MLKLKSEDLTAQIDGLENKIEQQEHLLATEGGNYARQRGTFEHQQEQLKTKIEDLENKIHAQCEELFPFALAPENLKRLKVRFP